MKLFVECCKSKEKDSLYQVLKIDFGYRTAQLFEVKKDVVAELADVKISDLYNMRAGDCIEIGTIIRKPNSLQGK